MFVIFAVNLGCCALVPRQIKGYFSPLPSFCDFLAMIIARNEKRGDASHDESTPDL